MDRIDRTAVLLAVLLCSGPAAVSHVAAGETAGEVAGEPFYVLADVARTTRPPQLEVRVAWLSLQRDTPDDTTLLTGRASGSPVFFKLLDASALDFGRQNGWEISATLRQTPESAVELRYFQVDSFSAETTLFRSDGWVHEFDGGALAIDTPVDYTYRYESLLRSAELNLLEGPAGSRVEWLAGFRWLEVNETLSAGIVPRVAVPGGSWKFSTRNDLYGLQVGVNALLTDRDSPLEFRATARTGLFYADRRSTFRTGYNNPLIDRAYSADDNTIAFAAELGISAIYRITQSIGLELSYHVLWIDDVALASEQAATTGYMASASHPQGTAINGGTVFYHGLNCGLVFTW